LNVYGPHPLSSEAIGAMQNARVLSQTDMEPYLLEGTVKHLWNRKHEESNTV